MGVPVFFKWLSTRNPKIILDAAEQSPQNFDSGNPHIDNFYIDMNGLIHPAVNPKGENIKVPKDFEQQIKNIEDYMDKIMNIVRPKKFVYLAIDGVAPRAKMNQQRSRRFRAAMQGEQSRKEKQKIYEEYKKMDIKSSDIEEYVFKESFDSNLITPGTKFLRDVAERIRVYIRKRLASDRHWKNLTVVFSDANCPGEGEHKIMEYIRQQRASPNYDPNQSHCIYGADADLIMLGLATHEPRFYIIREIVVTANDKWCTTCGKKGHFFIDCTVADSIEDEMKAAEKMNAESIGVSFQFVKIKAVRQFIHVRYEHCTFSPSFKFDLERIIDDFVFMCFFVGNDFLPHIPCLSIRQGGIDVLMRVYEHCLKIMPDYITNVGRLNMKSLRIFIRQLSYYEPELVGQLINKEYNQKQRQNFEKNIKPGMIKNLQEHNPKFQKQMQKQRAENSSIDPHDLLGSFKEEIKKRITPEISLDDYSAFNHDIFSYKEKYYSEKFRIEPKEFLQLKSSISKKYLQALEWVCMYYYEGVPSWDWFYPFHYSPFLTDIDVPQTNTVFEIGTPFKPFQQLMGVFPQKTSYALPAFLQPLMLDINSPISDYFPSQFIIDIVGKKFAWLGEVLLPFIDSKRLLAAMGDYQSRLNEQERRLNSRGKQTVYISRYGVLGRTLSNTQNLELGQKIILRNQDHNIAGETILLMQYNQTSTLEFYFTQPSGLKHDINLKPGIEYNPLQEINQDFVSRTDKRSYGGERFVRVIEKSLGKRLQVERRKQKWADRGATPQSRLQNRVNEERQMRQPRDRSRDYRRANQYRNQGYNNDNSRRGGYDNRRQGYERTNEYRNSEQNQYSSSGRYNQGQYNHGQYENRNQNHQGQNPNYQRQNYQMQNQYYQNNNNYPNNNNNNNNNNKGY